MPTLLSALGGALSDLFRFRVLLIVILPILAAALLWLGIAIAFWEPINGWLTAGLTKLGIEQWLAGVEPKWIASALQVAIDLLLYTTLVYLTALFFTALFAMPALVRIVASNHYPLLARKQGGGLFGSLLNAAIALIGFVALWLLSLPLWFFGVGMLMPLIAAAYLNQRLFRFDALAEHADREEMTHLFARYPLGWWGLGVITGLLQFIPFLNLFAPVFAALAFIHYGLARLESLRSRSAPTGN